MEIDNFFGRRAKLDLLKKRVADLKEGYRQNIAFLGSRYLGKSSLLQKFVHDMDDNDIVTIYLDLENKDFSHFYLKYVSSILRSIPKIKTLPVTDDINLLLESTQSHPSHTIKAIKKIQSLMAQNKTNEIYREVLLLAETFTNETGKYCVLVFDEFHHLEDYGIPDVFKELGKRIMTQKRCLYLFASSHQVAAKKILSEKLSLLFGNFEIIQVEAFDLKTSHGFIGFNLKDLVISEQLRNFLIDFTGGHPLYLHLICKELVALSAIHKQTEVFAPLLSQAVENVLLNPWGVLSRHFELILNRLSAGKNQVIPPVFIVLAQGKQKLKELAIAVGSRQNVLNEKLNILIEEDVTAKNGNFYYFKDKLFKYWIKHVFQKRLRIVESTPEQQKQEFHEELSGSIEIFNKNSVSDLSTRIIDLLNCFDNEALSINGRRYKLPVFDEISPAKFRNLSGEAFDILKATSEEGPWFIVLKKDSISETEVQTIVSESKKLKAKGQRYVLISMNELDENTRVKALQEKMWIWNEGEINTLLNIYNKPYII